MAFYTISLGVIAVSFVGVSVVKIIAFLDDEDSNISSCGWQVAVMIFTFLCVLGIAGMFCALVFVGSQSQLFWYLLGGIAVCFVIAMCLVGCFTGIKKSDDDDKAFGDECKDVDRNPPDRIKDIIEGKTKNGTHLRENFLGAVVMMFIVKTIGMITAIVFAAADMI